MGEREKGVREMLRKGERGSSEALHSIPISYRHSRAAEGWEEEERKKGTEHEREIGKEGEEEGEKGMEREEER